MLSFVSVKMEGAATHVTFWAMSAAGERPFDELVSSYRRTSFTVKLPLRTQFLSGANNYHNLSENLFLKIEPKMRDVLGKMRKCGKYVKMRDFPHDCGMVDTYANHLSSNEQVGPMCWQDRGMHLLFPVSRILLDLPSDGVERRQRLVFYPAIVCYTCLRRWHGKNV